MNESKDNVVLRVTQTTLVTKTTLVLDELIKTESSNVASIGYSEVDKSAVVVFAKSGMYKYEDVEKEDFEALRDAVSVGKYFSNVFLKKGYKYEKLDKNTSLMKRGDLKDSDLIKIVEEKAENEVLAIIDDEYKPNTENKAENL